MSLYNMINGVNNATFFAAPLVVGHPQNNVARFRDCFIEGETGDIVIFTRLGGGNREAYQAEIDKLRATPGYIKDYDSEEDSTYAYFHFGMPTRFKADIDLLVAGEPKKASPEYKKLIIETFPKISDKLYNLFF